MDGPDVLSLQELLCYEMPQRTSDLDGFCGRFERGVERCATKIVPGCCDHGNEPWGSIKGTEFLDQLSDC
jgi:hypothetical protein